MSRGVKGSGSSPTYSPETPYKYSGKYFATHEQGRAYRERSNLIRRAQRAGFGITEEELDRFKKSEQLTTRIIETRKERDRRERAERDKLREKHGLHPKAHVTGRHAAAKVKEEGRVLLAKESLRRLSDSERLDYVRDLYRQRTTMNQTDLLIRIGQAIGEL